MSPTQERVELPGSQGARLAARLHRPEGTPRGAALFAHCFSCSKDLKAAYHVSGALAARGIAVLRFDFTGLGESEGDFAETSFSTNIDDLVAAAAWLREHVQAPDLLVGHSLGGAAVIAAAEHIPEVRAVATLAAPSDPAHLKELLGPVSAEAEEQGEAEAVIGGRSFRIRRSFLEDLERHGLDERLARLHAALLVLHSPDDETVGIEHAGRLFEAARHSKSFVSLDGADHLLSRNADSRYAGELIAAWADRYLGTAPDEARRPSVPDTDAAPALDGHRVAVEAGASGLAQRIRAGRHALAADEPEELGGTDTGPDPYGLLLAALGACTSMTMRMYAGRKGWPLDGIRVELDHQKVHAKDCADCESSAGKVDVIDRVIHLEGELSAEQRARLLEIADKCPVHRTLHSEVKIRTKEG